MPNFCEVSDVEELLQIEIVDADAVASCERAIREASAAIRGYTCQYLSAVPDDAITLDVWERRSLLMLPELPILSVASVVEDGITLTGGTDYVLAGAGQLLRGSGAPSTWRTWAVGPQIVTVVYSHGYMDIPQKIVDVATRAAARAYQAGLQSAQTGGVLGVRSVGLGDFSLGFHSTQGGGVSEGALGASGARFLLLSEKDALDEYRHKI